MLVVLKFTKMSFFRRFMKVRSKYVQHDFQPIYYFSRFAGLWPFSIDYESDGSIRAARIYPIDWLWFFVSICLYLTAAFYYFDRIMIGSDHRNNAFISNQMYFMSQMAFLSFTVLGIILNMYNCHKVIKILHMFIIFDRDVSVNLLFNQLRVVFFLRKTSPIT